MSTKTVVFSEAKHNEMVGRADRVSSKIIDAQTELKLLKADLLGTMTPTAPTPPTSGSGIGLPKLILVLVVCVSVGGNNYTREATVMANAKKQNPGPLLDGARKAALDKDWDTACMLFARAYEAGADPDESLGRGAECDYYAGRHDRVKGACDALDKATYGKSKVSSYVRGLVALQAKDYPAARVEFKLAIEAGHPLGKVMLKRVPHE